MVLTRRALNRSFLARQHLLARTSDTALDVIAHLVALQAQQPRPPFTGLWTRVKGFKNDDLLGLVRTRKIVRATTLRGTLHLLTANDYIKFRSMLQPALDLGMKVLADRAAGIDVGATVEVAKKLYVEPRTFTEVRAALIRSFPGVDERALGYIVRTQLPLVIVPDDSPWGYPSDPRFTLPEPWLGGPLEKGQLEDLVLRYLAAFGPATPADMQAWSGLQGLKPVFEKLRPQLETFRDERKRELFDLPDAPRLHEDADAPVRFLPGFDNAILGHADRSRIIADDYRSLVTTKNLQVLPTFLVDGFVAGTWSVARVKKAAVLTISPFGALSAAARKAVEAEGEGLVRFAEPEAEKHEIVVG